MCKVCKECSHEIIKDGAYWCDIYDKYTEGNLLYNGDGSLVTDKHIPDWCEVDEQMK